MFAAVPGFSSFYGESDMNNYGLECLRLLNEIFGGIKFMPCHHQLSTITFRF